MICAPSLNAEPVTTVIGEAPRPFESIIQAPKKSTASRAKAKLPKNPTRTGIASWYSETDPGINRHTANGEVFDDSRMTCAAWDYPFNTHLQVTNLQNGKSVVCRVNDRGPNKRLRRLVDLTKTAFRKIETPRKGLVRVSVRVVSKPAGRKL